MTDGLPLPRRYVAIGAISAGTALVIIDGGIATVALPTIARDLHVGNSAVVAVVTVYQLILAMMILPFAGLGDKFGLKRTYQFGQLVFTVATMLCFFARSLPFLLVVRAAQALGAAAALSVSSALIRSIYPSKQLGRGLGINSVVVSSSAALAPTIGGLVLGVAPWPWVFASAVPFAILSLLLGRALPAPQPRDETFDVLGAVMCASMIGLVISGAESAVHGDSPVVSAAIVAVGAGIGWFFIRRERHEAKPILPIDLLAKPVIALSAVGAYTAFTASMTLLLSTPFRLTHGYGFTPAEVGAAIAPWPLTNMIVAPLAGWLSDRVPAGLLGGIGMAVSIVALLLIATLPADAAYFDIAWRMALCGSGFGLFLPPNARLIIGSAPRERAAAAGGSGGDGQTGRADDGSDLGGGAARSRRRRRHDPAARRRRPRAGGRPVQPRPPAPLDPQSPQRRSGRRTAGDAGVAMKEGLFTRRREDAKMARLPRQRPSSTDRPASRRAGSKG